MMSSDSDRAPSTPTASRRPMRPTNRGKGSRAIPVATRPSTGTVSTPSANGRRASHVEIAAAPNCRSVALSFWRGVGAGGVSAARPICGGNSVLVHGRWQDRSVPSAPYYRTDLARVHHEGFAFHADAVAPGILKLLEPVRPRRGLVVEIGCGSGLLTRYLVDAGHDVVATDASPAMVALARDYVPAARAIEELRLPDDPIPDADAIVSVGHPLSYLDNEEQQDQALVALASALRPGGLLAFDVCDLPWGEARRGEPPRIWFGDDWVLITRTSVPDRSTFRREMTTFVRSENLWRRDDEVHDNVLVDTSRIPALLEGFGVDAEVKSSFGDEALPDGLVAVVGYRRSAG
jgi:SAM-dependent methyltransferase